LWDGATQTVNIDDEGTDIWIGQGSGDKLLAWNGSALSLRSNNTDVITLDTSGNSYFAGVMTIGTSGEIRQGTGTLGSNYTGLRIWRDSSVGRIAGYNSDIVQWYAGTDGRLYAGAGSVQIHSAGIDIQQDGYITPDAARSISWWEDIGSTSGTPTQTIKAFYNALGENVLSLEAMPQGGFYTDSRVDLVADAVSVTWYSSGILEVGGSITLSGTVDGVDIAAFKTAYDSHNHSGVYLPLSGGTITGTVTARDITFSADNTYDIGASDKRVQDLYVVNLRADNILGTPTFGHSHDSDYVNVDGDTMTNQLTMAFDNHQMIILDRTANANVDSTFFVGVSYVTGVSDDFAFLAKLMRYRFLTTTRLKSAATLYGTPAMMEPVAA
jgi:hypothetical protein